MTYYHVDVFAPEPLAGNGLTVVFAESELDNMLEITREFRQYETIFLLKPRDDGSFPARIFTMDEELDFAGHPVLGAGAVLHHRFFKTKGSVSLSLTLGERTVPLISDRKGDHYSVTMDQGAAEFLGNPEEDLLYEILERSGLSREDSAEGCRAEVVSTGLPYLLIPLRKNSLERIRIAGAGFETLLGRCRAKFAYYFEPDSLEGRTWDNEGRLEDIATGSAAGPLCCYLVKNGLSAAGEEIAIRQGRFLGRPSVIRGIVDSAGGVSVKGDVALFASGEIAV